jgi:hypothetical protein
MRVSMVDGLGQTSVSARARTTWSGSAAGAGYAIGINQNSGTATPNLQGYATAPTSSGTDNIQTLTSEETFPPLLGFNYYQGMETAASGTSVTVNAGTYQAVILDTEY